MDGPQCSFVLEHGGVCGRPEHDMVHSSGTDAHPFIVLAPAGTSTTMTTPTTRRNTTASATKQEPVE